MMPDMDLADVNASGPARQQPGTLLGPNDPPAYRCLPGKDTRALLLCDHASNHVPEALAGLGLPPAELERHIASDLHAEALTVLLAQALQLPAVFHGVSRLVVDANRYFDDPSLCPEHSDGTAVPGNIGLGQRQRQQRWQQLHQPYHRAIAGWLGQRLAAGMYPALIAIHTFTPRLRDGSGTRPWHVGVLWNADGRMALPFMAWMREREGLVVGDNQPYSGRDGFGYTMAEHAEARGLPHLLVEVRKDLLATPQQRREWCDRLVRAISPLLADAALFQPWSAPDHGTGGEGPGSGHED